MSHCSRCGYENPESAQFCLKCDERLDHGDDLFIGTVIAERFRIDEHLGEGGMGSVYLGVDISTHNAVAVKILHPAMARDQKFLIRFQNEAELAGSLNHPNIVRVLATGTIRDSNVARNTCYIVMDYLPGGDLSSLIRKRRTLSVIESFRIAAQVADALAYAHEQGIIHRDIKPGNIMFTGTDPKSTVVITDFGIAKAMGIKGQTTPGTALGTPEYMSLEQVRGRELDGRTDVYSLGVVLYQMLTGVSPFRTDAEGESHGAVSTIAAILDQQAKPLDEYRPDIDKRVQSVVKKAMAKDRTSRYQTAEDLLNAMYRAVGKRALLGEQAGGRGFFRRLFPPKPRPAIVDDTPVRVEEIPPPEPTTVYGGMGTGRALLVAFLLILIVSGVVATALLATQTLTLPEYLDIERITRHFDLAELSRDGGGGGGGGDGGGTEAGGTGETPPENGGETGNDVGNGVETPAAPDAPSNIDIGPVSIFSFGAEDEADHEVLWARNLAAPLRTSPVLGDGTLSSTIFVVSGNGLLYALDVLTGELRWHVDSGGDILSSPLYYTETIYAGEYNGTLFAWDAAGGERLWKFRTPGGIFPQPVALDDTVITGGDEGMIYAVDALTGDELWMSDVGGDLYAPPAIWKDALFAASLDHFLYAVDATYGTELWRFEAGSALYAAPVAREGWVFLGDVDGVLYALDAETGTLMWRRKTGGSIFSPPTVSGETYFVGSADGYVYALNARTGAAYWKRRVGAAVGSTPFVLTEETPDNETASLAPPDVESATSPDDASTPEFTDWMGTDDTLDGEAPVSGIVYVGCRDHSLYALDAATGEVLFRFETGGEVDSSPVAVVMEVPIRTEDVADEALEGAADGGDVERTEAPEEANDSPGEGDVGGEGEGTDDAPVGTEIPTEMKAVIFFGSDDGYFYAIW